MSTIGSMAVNVLAKTAGFNKPVKASRKELSRFTRQAKKSTDRIGKFSDKIDRAQAPAAGMAGSLRGLATAAKTAGVAIAVGAIVMIDRLIEKSSALIDVLGKTADRLGITTQDLGRLHHAAKLGGLSSQTLDMALQRMTRRLAEAARGGGEAQKAIKELGLDAQRLATLSPRAALGEIADALNTVENSSDKVRLAFKFFDAEGVKLINMLEGGSLGLTKAGQEADKFGLAISGADAALIQLTTDAETRAGAAIDGLGNRMAIATAKMRREWANAKAEIFSGQFKKDVMGDLASGNLFSGAEQRGRSRGLDADIAAGNARRNEIAQGRAIAMAKEKARLDEAGARRHDRIRRQMIIGAREDKLWQKNIKPLLDGLRQEEEAFNKVGRAAKLAALGKALGFGFKNKTDYIEAVDLDKRITKMEELRKKQQQLADSQRDMAQRGMDAFEKTRSPIERLKRDLLDLAALQDSGAIDKTTTVRRRDQLLKSFEDQQNSEPPSRRLGNAAALQKGTAAAFSAANRGSLSSEESEAKKTREGVWKQLSQVELQTVTLDGILTEVKKQSKATVSYPL